MLGRIIHAFNPQPQDNIIEIGPGTGALTERLVQLAPKFTVIELDRDLIDLLDGKFNQGADVLDIIQSDVLNVNFRSIEPHYPGHGGFRLIGNLPYNISTPLIFHLLDHVDLFDDMIFMLQKEVADRLAAEANTKHYGRLTVMTAVDLQCQCLFDVPPGAFSPPPKVDSTIIRLRPRKTPIEVHDRQILQTVVKAAFSQRRKTIRNGLRGMVDVHQLEQAGIAPSRRAETITVEEYAGLANLLSTPDLT